MASKHKSCKSVVIGQRHVFQVTYCKECKSASLHIGGLSLRFEPSALEDLWAVLGESVSRLRHEQREQLRDAGRQVTFEARDDARHDVH